MLIVLLETAKQQMGYVELIQMIVVLQAIDAWKDPGITYGVLAMLALILQELENKELNQ